MFAVMVFMTLYFIVLLFQSIMVVDMRKIQAGVFGNAVTAMTSMSPTIINRLVNISGYLLAKTVMAKVRHSWLMLNFLTSTVKLSWQLTQVVFNTTKATTAGVNIGTGNCSSILQEVTQSVARWTAVFASIVTPENGNIG